MREEVEGGGQHLPTTAAPSSMGGAEERVAREEIAVVQRDDEGHLQRDANGEPPGPRGLGMPQRTGA